jgi:hypothetical protein
MDVAIPVPRMVEDGYRDFVYPGMGAAIFKGKLFYNPTHGGDRGFKKADYEALIEFAWSKTSCIWWRSVHPIDYVADFTDLYTKKRIIFDHRVGTEDKIIQWQSKCKLFLLKIKKRRNRQLAIVMATHNRLGNRSLIGNMLSDDAVVSLGKLLGSMSCS